MPRARDGTRTRSSQPTLDVAGGAPILVLDETLIGDGPHPLLWSTVRYGGERYRRRATFRTR